jgi:hypothetical protein
VDRSIVRVKVNRATHARAIAYWHILTNPIYFLMPLGVDLESALTFILLREGPCSQGAFWAVCGSGVPPYDFLNLYGVFDSRFSTSLS